MHAVFNIVLLVESVVSLDSLGFCQVYLHCDLESCISRNQSRSEPIPTEVIQEMVKRLQSPNPQKNSWEANSISVNTTAKLSECDV